MLQLLLGLIDSLDPLHNILFQLFDLVLKPLLVLLVLLLMLTLDDLLSLFSDSIKLNILGPLLEIFNLKIESLLDVLYSFEVRFELGDPVHQFDFVFTLPLDASVLNLNDLLGYEDSIFVVGGDRKLRNLNPSLLDVNNGLKVIPDFLDSVRGFLLSHDLTLALLFDILVLSLKVVDVVLKLCDLVLKLLLIFVHLNSGVPFLDESTKIILREVVDLVVSLEVVLLLLVFNFQYLFNSTSINSRERIKHNNSRHQLLLPWVLFPRDSNLFGFSLSNEIQDLLEVDIWEHLFELSLLIF